jgi:signal peptidase I
VPAQNRKYRIIMTFQTPAESKRKAVPRTLKVLYFLAVFTVCALLLRTFVIDSFVVSGDSMAPTIIEGDIVFINKLSTLVGLPARGDIVVGNFRTDDIRVIKRVVGMPREWVVLESNQAYVREGREGEPVVVRELYPEQLKEYLGTSTDYSYRLDPYEYFLLGDNALFSSDSREFGPVDTYAIQGKVFMRVNLKEFKLEIL